MLVLVSLSGGALWVSIREERLRWVEAESPVDPLRPSAPPVLICCLLTRRDLRPPPPGPAPWIAPGCSADCCLSACCPSPVTARRPRKCPLRTLEWTNPSQPPTETWSVSAIHVQTHRTSEGMLGLQVSYSFSEDVPHRKNRDWILQGIFKSWRR